MEIVPPKSMKFTIDEIVKATDAVILKCQNNSGLFTVSTDSRTIEYNEIYLPLKGPNFDGHDYIADAMEKGARGFFTSSKRKKHENAKFILYVKDTLKAYLKLALYCKRKISPITVAITGSSGKTTTKEMMAHALAEQYKVHKSELNYNNEIGLCKTILSMPEDTEVLVLEMGMRGLGEIELLSKYSEPDVAVIVNTGTAHIGRLGSVENIAKAKCEISKHLHKEGLLIADDTKLICNGNTYKGRTIYAGLNSMNLQILSKTVDSSEFEYKNHRYHLDVEGEYNIANAVFVIEAGLRLGVSVKKIAKGLAKYRPIEKRWEVEKIKGYKVINDSYNANPESVKAALSTFLDLYDGDKLVVLGDMGELGLDEIKYHEEIGTFLNNYVESRYKINLITVGKLSENIAKTTKIESKSFDSNENVAKYIIENIPESTTILFKASRSMKFEEIIEELKK